jgi:hypothetical protein
MQTGEELPESQARYRSLDWLLLYFPSRIPLDRFFLESMWEYKLLLRVLSIRISIELTCTGGRMKPVSPPICLFSNCIQHVHMQRAPTYAIFVNQIIQRALRHDSRFYVSWLEGCQNNCLGQTKPNFLLSYRSLGSNCILQVGTKVSKCHTASM